MKLAALQHRYSSQLVVGAGFLTLALAYSGRATLGLSMPAIEAEMGWSRSFLSSAAGCTLVVMAVLAPVVGRIVDRRGPRVPLAAGLAAIAAGSFGVAASHDRVTFILAFSGLAAVGFGSTAVHVVSSAVAHSVRRALGFATGIATSGSTAGQFIIVPLVAGVLAVGGWRLSFAAIGVGCLLLVPAVWMVLPGSGRGDGGNGGLAAAIPPMFADLRDIVRKPPFHILLWSFFICGYTTTGVIETHLLPYASFCGFGPVPSATAYGILSAVNMAGMILSGWLADRVHRPLLLGSIYLVRGLSFFILIHVGADYTTLVAFAVLFGAVDYSTVPVTVSLVKTHVGSRVVGLAIGTIAAGHAVGAALGAFLGGYLFDVYAKYEWVWLSSLALAVFAGMLVFLLREQSAALPAEASA